MFEISDTLAVYIIISVLCGVVTKPNIISLCIATFTDAFGLAYMRAGFDDFIHRIMIISHRPNGET